MAVAKSNDMFDWCDDIARAKTNYSDAECLDLFKRSTKGIGGIDKAFYDKVNAATMKDVRFDNRYAPVYFLTIRATYTTERFIVHDDHSTTTTRQTNVYTFDKSTFAGIYDSTKLGNLVGRNDERLYKLSHVDDLPYPLYNNDGCFTREQMRGRVFGIASREYTGSCFVNGFTCRAVLVPVVCVSIEYCGKRYTCVVNKHNGCTYLSYPTSKAVADGAKKMFRTFITYKKIGFGFLIGAGVALIPQIFLNGFWSTVFAVVVCGGLGLILRWWLGYREVFAMRQQTFLDRFAKTGRVDRKLLKNIIIFMSACIVIFVLAVVLLIVL